MANEQKKPAPVKVIIPDGPTFKLNDMAEFNFDATDAEFQALHAAYKAAKQARDAYLLRAATVEFKVATGHDLPAGYVIKAGLSRFGGATNGKAWAVIDHAPTPKVATVKGFAKWGAAE